MILVDHRFKISECEFKIFLMVLMNTYRKWGLEMS